MNRTRRVVFDTSTLVSAVLKEGSTPDRAFKKAIDSCLLCVSNETLEELEAVLARRKFDRYVGLDSRKAFVALVTGRARVIEVSDAVLRSIDQNDPRCRDAKDDKFLALAKASGADVIVSSDQDLLVLHPWRGIAILRPSEFLA